MDTFIQKIVDLASQTDGVYAVWLYGSQVDGSATADSDFDLAVGFLTHQNSALAERLKPELLAQKWFAELGLSLDKLSLVDIAQIPITLGWEVVTKGKVIFESNERLRAEAENRILSAYEIDIARHRRNQDDNK